MFQGLLGKVAEDLVRAAAVISNEMDAEYQHQANGIDRPSFGAMVIKTMSKHGLSELLQAWLVGDMVYVPYGIL